MEENYSHQLVIIGGGISGLAAGYYALRRAEAEGRALRLILLEAGPAWGGKIATQRIDGFVIEGGPDTFLATRPWAAALCRELGLGDRLHGTNPSQRSTYVMHNQRLLPLPDGLAMMIPTHFGSMARTRLLNWPQKARMGLDFILPPRPLNGDESLGAFASRRLGRAAYENLIEPLMSGIYAGDGDQLSLGSTFPYLREMEVKHGGLVRGALAMKAEAARRGKAAQGSRSAFLTPTTGLAEIVEALTAWLAAHGADLRLSTRARDVQAGEAGYRVEIAGQPPLPADGLILATPAYVSGDLLGGLDRGLSRHLHAIPYTSTATISLAYRQADLPRPLDGYGYVIPRREGRRALACTWTSTKFPHRAPEGFALLRVFVGRAGQEAGIPWDEAGLQALAQEELRLTLRVTAAPVLSRVFRWEKAMPQYNLGHPQRLQAIEAAVEAHPGLALAGNGYRGIGIPDCIHSGEQAVAQVWTYLEANRLAG